MPTYKASLALDIDPPDDRDLLFDPGTIEPPSVISLDKGNLPALRQGLHDCVVHPPISALQYFTGLEFSRRFLYYTTRKLCGHPARDTGGNLRAAFKALQKWGAPLANDYPYDLSLPWDPDWLQPSAAMFDAAAAVRRTLFPGLKYCRVKQSARAICGTLEHGQPVCFGFYVPLEFLRSQIAKTGIFTWKKNSVTTARHAGLIWAMNSKTKMATVLNSFGKAWGQEGSFQIPYSYLLNPKRSNDFWTISL